MQDSLNVIQGAVRVSLASYNETGQLIKKGLHSINGTSNFLQNLDYRYNPRGWLTNINNPTLTADGGTTNTDLNDQFGMELKYDNVTSSRPQYNGNIATTTVKTGSVSGTAFSAFTYDYRYDKLNRLNDAVSTTATTKDGFHSEYATYDNMGNITNLGRYDKIGPNRTAIDTLTYTYIGNRVDRIDDASAYAGTFGFTNGVSQAGEYTYDGNGNQLKDLNKGLTGFTYNLLNLPQTITRSNGNTTVYVYDATGRKLRKLFTAGATTTTDEYINGIQYEYTGSTPVLAFIQTEEGRARKTGTTYVYEYDLKDHLGNTRITTTWDPADATQLTPKNAQHTDYYAFGYAIQSLQGTISSPKNEYLYNGKELQEETGLYDYGARLYDPVIGRWTSVDPLAEKNRRWSPYVYGKNNSIRFIDPDGMDDKDLFGRDKHNADGMYVPPTDRGAKDFEYNGEKTREDHEQNDDSGENAGAAATSSSASTDQSTDGSACNLDENDAAGNGNAAQEPQFNTRLAPDNFNFQPVFGSDWQAAGVKGCRIILITRNGLFSEYTRVVEFNIEVGLPIYSAQLKREISQREAQAETASAYYSAILSVNKLFVEHKIADAAIPAEVASLMQIQLRKNIGLKRGNAALVSNMLGTNPGAPVKFARYNWKISDLIGWQ